MNPFNRILASAVAVTLAVLGIWSIVGPRIEGTIHPAILLVVSGALLIFETLPHQGNLQAIKMELFPEYKPSRIAYGIEMELRSLLVGVHEAHIQISGKDRANVRAVLRSEDNSDILFAKAHEMIENYLKRLGIVPERDGIIVKIQKVT